MTTTDLCPLGYLGPQSDHRSILEQVLASVGRPLTCVDDSLTFGRRRRGRFGRLLTRAARTLAQLRGRANSHYLDEVTARLDAGGVRCVVAYWGINPLADVIALKRRRPELKVILNVLCHPLALTPGRIAVQNILMRRASRWLDGYIFPSHAMRAYFEAHALIAEQPSVVIPPCLPLDAHPSEFLPDEESAPNLVFLGRMDWSSAQPTDNVGDLIDGLLDRGIHVSHHSTIEPVRQSPYRHTFEYMSLGAVTQFCTQFQATLVAYNTAACSRDVRFRVTVPDRLVAGVAAGLPVFLPRCGYEGCWEYLADYPAVIPFDTADDVRRTLADVPRMSDLRTAARASRGSYAAESHLDPLLAFLTSIAP